MDYEKFVFEQNSLTIDEEPNSCYQIVSHGSDEVWATLPVPSEVEKVGEAIREIADSFPMGRHHLRLQSLTKSKVVRAQLLIPVEGRNSAMGKASRAEDHVTMSKALRANVEVSEQQLASMGARLQAEETRNLELQERLVANSTQTFEMVTLLQNIVSDREDREMKRLEHEARMQGISSFAEKATPYLLPVVGMAAQYFGKKLEEMMKKDAEKSAPAPSPKAETASDPPN